jgi:hypothetical protein
VDLRWRLSFFLCVKRQKTEVAVRVAVVAVRTMLIPVIPVLLILLIVRGKQIMKVIKENNSGKTNYLDIPNSPQPITLL